MLVLTFFLGVVLNAIGYIPPGNINLTVVQITISKGIKQAYAFIIAFSTVEVLFTFAIMRFVRWLESEIQFGNVIDFLMILMFTVLGIITFRSRKKLPKPDTSHRDSIKYGAFLGAINPMQIPFWLFVGTYLVTHEWIEINYLSLIIFSLGSGIGAGLALYGFAHFAKFIQEKFELSSYLISKAIAYLFFALALYHVGKIIFIYCIK